MAVTPWTGAEGGSLLARADDLASAQNVVEKPLLSEENPPPAVLTREYCSACHSFQLVESQRLNRATWEWVIADMVGKFGAGWITPTEQTIILDYLVEHYGPKKKRRVW